MNHNFSQKEILNNLKYYIKINKKKIDTANSSICYFHNYGKIPGAATLRLKVFGLKYLLQYLLIFLKSIVLVAKLKNCRITKTQTHTNKFKNLFISHATKSDFNPDGSYNDRYFN